MKKKWSDMDKVEKVSALIRLAARGMTASQIAAEFHGCSRNAVIGMAHRNGVVFANAKGRSKPFDPANSNVKAPSKKVAAKNSRPAKVTRIKKAAKKQKPEPTVCEILKFEDPKRNPPPYSMIDVGPTDCRWPICESYRGLSPEAMMFCGKSRDGGSRYCVEHRRISFNGYARSGGIKAEASEEKPERKRRPFFRWQS